jgi:hypothetical protein
MYDEESLRKFRFIPYIIEENLRKNFYINSPNIFDPRENNITNFIAEYGNINNPLRTLPEDILKMKV